MDCWKLQFNGPQAALAAVVYVHTTRRKGKPMKLLSPLLPVFSRGRLFLMYTTFLKSFFSSTYRNQLTGFITTEAVSLHCVES